jgi:hypothetical protein
MRDIVSEVGTFYQGLSQNQTVTATQHSAAISVIGNVLGKYNGVMVYVLTGTFTSTATMVVTIEVTNDSGGSPVSNNWTAIPVTDQVVWEATSATDGTPVKIGNVVAPTLSATHGVNQRIGWFGSGLTFTANSSPGDGLSHNIDYFRVTSTYGGSGNAVMDVAIVLGQPRIMPAAV